MNRETFLYPKSQQIARAPSIRNARVEAEELNTGSRKLQSQKRGDRKSNRNRQTAQNCTNKIWQFTVHELTWICFQVTLQFTTLTKGEAKVTDAAGLRSEDQKQIQEIAGAYRAKTASASF